MNKRDQLEQQLQSWGRFCRYQAYKQAGGYGNSPSHRLIEGKRLGFFSFGTAYFDQSSETIQHPEWFEEIDQAINALPKPVHRAVMVARYVQFGHEQIKAARIGVSRGFYRRMLVEAKMFLLSEV